MHYVFWPSLTAVIYESVEALFWLQSCDVWVPCDNNHHNSCNILLCYFSDVTYTTLQNLLCSHAGKMHKWLHFQSYFLGQKPSWWLQSSMFGPGAGNSRGGLANRPSPALEFPLCLNCLETQFIVGISLPIWPRGAIHSWSFLAVWVALRHNSSLEFPSQLVMKPNQRLEFPSWLDMAEMAEE